MPKPRGWQEPETEMLQVLAFVLIYKAFDALTAILLSV